MAADTRDPTLWLAGDEHENSLLCGCRLTVRGPDSEYAVEFYRCDTCAAAPDAITTLSTQLAEVTLSLIIAERRAETAERALRLKGYAS